MIPKNTASLPKGGGAHIRRGTDGWSVYFWNTAERVIQYPSPDNKGKLVTVKAGDKFYDTIKNKVQWGNIGMEKAYQVAQTIGKKSKSSSSGATASPGSRGPVVPAIATIQPAKMLSGTTGKVVAGGLAVVIGGLLVRRMLQPSAPQSIIAPPMSSAQKFIEGREQDELEKLRAQFL
jgi:hypothetical protein